MRHIFQAGRQRVADPVEIGAQPDVVYACEFDDVVNVVGNGLDVSVEVGVFLLELVNDGACFGGAVAQAFFLEQQAQLFALLVVVLSHFAVEEGRAEVDLDDPAIFAEGADHIVVHVALEAGRELAAGGMGGDDGHFREA